MGSEINNKIGILGGTFNPVHLGHLLLAQSAMEIFDLAKVLFIPCAKPPHKNPPVLASAEHRMAMIEAAIEDDPAFEASDVEIQRQGPSYTIDTLTELKEANPDADFHFIIGSDSLLELHIWKDIGRLLTMCRFVTFARPGTNTAGIKAEDIHLDPPWPQTMLKNVARGRLIDISSSDIRHRVAEGMSIRYLVPRAVEMHIAEHNLYGK